MGALLTSTIQTLLGKGAAVGTSHLWGVRRQGLPEARAGACRGPALPGCLAGKPVSRDGGSGWAGLRGQASWSVPLHTVATPEGRSQAGREPGIGAVCRHPGPPGTAAGCHAGKALSPEEASQAGHGRDRGPCRVEQGLGILGKVQTSWAVQNAVVDFILSS